MNPCVDPSDNPLAWEGASFVALVFPENPLGMTTWMCDEEVLAVVWLQMLEHLLPRSSHQDQLKTQIVSIGNRSHRSVQYPLS